MRGVLRKLVPLLAAAAVCGLGRGDAALLAPALVDANTGQDALDVGASFGNRRAWAGFVQKTGGADRFYAAFAQDGAFRPPMFADGGNAVVAAALAGNAGGDAVGVWTEKVAGKDVLLSRRLVNGQPGPVIPVSPSGADVQLASVQHRRIVAVNTGGTAVVCFKNNDDMGQYAAILLPGNNTWAVRGPLQSTVCEDVAIDDRGIAIVIGTNANGRPEADRIVNGQVRSEEIDANGKDEPSVALTKGGLALAFARVDDNGDFRFAAYRKRDIAQDGAWEALGRVDVNASLATENTEFARAALAPNGKGIATFRVNNPGTNTARVYADVVDAGAAAPFGSPQKLSDVPVGQDAVPNVDANGNGLAVYNVTGANGKLVPNLRLFANGVPGPAMPLDAGTGTDVELRNVPSFVTDAAGNFLVLLRQGNAPVRAAAIFGDFLPPVLQPTWAPATVGLGLPVAFTSGATDSFAAITDGDVRWTFAAGTVDGPLSLAGLTVTQRFVHPGVMKIPVSATDRGGNRADATVGVTVLPPKLRAAPSRVLRSKRVTVTGKGFIPGERINVTIKRSRAKAKRLRARANANGAFRLRYRVPKKARRAKYVATACQRRGCTIKARTTYRAR